MLDSNQVHNVEKTMQRFKSINLTIKHGNATNKFIISPAGILTYNGNVLLLINCDR